MYFQTAGTIEEAYLLHLIHKKPNMADLQQELQKLFTSHEEKHRLYNDYLETSKHHNEKILKLAEMQPIEITDFEEAEEMYNNMILSEKTYRVQKEVFDVNRQDVINKLQPVQNIKIRFTYVNEKQKKDTTDYYVWLKYNPENPDESQLVVQKISDTDNEPRLL